MVDKGRLRRSWRDGGVSATRYERACPDAVKSSRDEDIKMHVDYWHGEHGVDVKGNNLPDEIWVEFRNVRGDNNKNQFRTLQNQRMEHRS